METIKYETREINISQNPVIIIGQCPGKTTRKALKEQNNKYLVFSGNRTGNFVNQLLKGIKNAYLTNVFNYYTDGVINEELIKQGMQELQEDIFKYKPRKIVCLGKFAHKQAQKLEIKCPIDILEHPSHVLRFNKDKAEYAQQFKNALK